MSRVKSTFVSLNYNLRDANFHKPISIKRANERGMLRERLGGEVEFHFWLSNSRAAEGESLVPPGATVSWPDGSS